MTHVNPDKRSQMQAWRQGPRDLLRFIWRYYKGTFIAVFGLAFAFAFTIVFLLVWSLGRL